MFTYVIVCFLLPKSTVRSLKICTQETFFKSTEWCEFQESTTSSLMLQHPWSLSCTCIFWKSPILVSFTEVHVSYSLSRTFPEPLPGPDPLHTSCEVPSARSTHGCPWVTTERCWVPATPSEVNGNSRYSVFLQRVAKRDGEYPDTGKKLQAEDLKERKFAEVPPCPVSSQVFLLLKQQGAFVLWEAALLKNLLRSWKPGYPQDWHLKEERLKRQKRACRESSWQAGALPALHPCTACICSCLRAPQWTASYEIFWEALKVFQVRGISTHFYLARKQRRSWLYSLNG